MPNYATIKTVDEVGNTILKTTYKGDILTVVAVDEETAKAEMWDQLTHREAFEAVEVEVAINTDDDKPGE